MLEVYSMEKLQKDPEEIELYEKAKLLAQGWIDKV